MADRYRVVGKRHRRTDDNDVNWFEPGDELEPTDAELSAFPDRFERVDQDDDEGDGGDEGGRGGPPFDPGDYSVGSLRDELDDRDLSGDDLDALADAERAGDDRTTALDAIESHRSETEE